VASADAEQGARRTIKFNTAELCKQSIPHTPVHYTVSKQSGSTREARDAEAGSGPESRLAWKDSINFNSKVGKPCIFDSAYI
jgi:hypothetical protein